MGEGKSNASGSYDLLWGRGSSFYDPLWGKGILVSGTAFGRVREGRDKGKQDKVRALGSEAASQTF